MNADGFAQNAAEQFAIEYRRAEALSVEVEMLQAQVKDLASRLARSEQDRLAWRQEFLDKNEDYGIALKNMDYYRQRGDTYRARALALLRQMRACRGLLAHSNTMQEHWANLARPWMRL